MTFPRVVSDLLMFAPSFSRCPVAPVELARSEPAKSIRLYNRCQSVHISKGKENQLDSRDFLRIEIGRIVMSFHGKQ
jgi:hypothetical protein